MLDGKRQYIDISGNLVTVIKSTVDVYKPPLIKPDAGADAGDEPEKPLYVSFRAFRENRRHVNVRVWDVTREPVGMAVFLAQPPKLVRNQTPVCMLTINLGDAEHGRYMDTVSPAADTSELIRRLAALPAVNGMSLRLRNDLYCVEWDVKLYCAIPYCLSVTLLTFYVANIISGSL